MSTNEIARRIAAAYAWPLDETAAGVDWYVRQIGLAGAMQLDARTIERFERVYPLI
ncbi:hypothetical protein SAMN03159343_0243 [Klenkia marina]|uniref:Uncharacterized protein n=1 Tax=Klenkia marina TaxID=1960309 RepID=A0A1G4X9N9_9ACTN|nr:hypothetical protein [Klenkia marina]SCX37936.1 hypothetical protein SAMN03159343_0243 [Klenkia marina]